MLHALVAWSVVPVRGRLRHLQGEHTAFSPWDGLGALHAHCATHDRYLRTKQR